MAPRLPIGAAILRRARLIVSSGGLVGFCVFAANAAPPDTHGLESIMMVGKRPTNFYTSLAQLDPAVCRPILASLNGEFSIDYKDYVANPRASVDSDLLLTSTLQVPWTRRLVVEPVTVGRAGYTMGSLDIALAGPRKLSLYRRTLQKYYPGFDATLHVNTLTMSDAALATFPGRQPLDPAVVDKIGGRPIAFDLTKFPSIGTHLGVEGKLATAVNVAMLAKAAAAPQPILLNVASLGRQLYILLVDAFEMEIEAPKAISGHIDLYVLRFNSINDIRPVCQFRSD